MVRVALALSVVVTSGCAVPATRVAAPVHVDPAPLATTTAASIDEGRRLYFARGCADCHGRDGGGARIVHAPFVVRLSGTNLAGVVGRVVDFDRALRHGVRSDGVALVGMPSHEYARLTDDEVAALHAFLASAPPVARALPTNKVGPLAVLADRWDVVPLVASRRIDHAAPRAQALPASSRENGARLAAASCAGCHGESLSGRRGFSANLTPHDDGLAGWTEQDFARALRTGVRPDGSAVGAAMPWASFSHLTDDEVRGLWAHLSTLSPRAHGR